MSLPNQKTAFNYQVSGASNIQVFESSGTWVKPPCVSFVHVCIWSGGGGGRGGSPFVGGFGGQGGARFSHMFFAGCLTCRVTVTVGAGGLGSAGSTAPSDGSAGGNSSFGCYSPTVVGGSSTACGQKKGGYVGAGGLFPPFIGNGQCNIYCAVGFGGAGSGTTTGSAEWGGGAGGKAGEAGVDAGGGGGSLFGGGGGGGGGAHVCSSQGYGGNGGSNSYATGASGNSSTSGGGRAGRTVNGSGSGGNGGNVGNNPGGNGGLYGGGGGGGGKTNCCVKLNKGGDGGQGAVIVYAW